MRKVALALAALVLMACGFDANVDPGPDLTVDMTPELVVGSWRSEARDATLVFAPEGTLRATNVPPEILPKFDGILSPSFRPDRDRIDATGTWGLPEKDPSVPDRHRNELKIVFDPGGYLQGRNGATLEAWWHGSKPSLVIGKVVYLKCDLPCAAPAPSPSR